MTAVKAPANANMKTIGIVGGVAWPSTITYYRMINEEIARRLGENGLHSAKLLISQTDFAEVEYNQVIGNWERVGELIASQANALEAAGADFFLIACNTVHTAMPYVLQRTKLPNIHIVDPAGEILAAKGIKTVGLMGSGYTMDGDFFKGRLAERYGMNVLIPEGEHKQNIHNALYQELTKGIFLPETRQKFKKCIQSLADRGAEAVILGCTEFNLIVDPKDSPVPVVDTTQAHAMAAVDRALGGK